MRDIESESETEAERQTDRECAQLLLRNDYYYYSISPF